MRHTALATVSLLATLFFSAHSFAAPGYQWEIRMEMEGMPFAMPAQKICAPKNNTEPPVTKSDDECKILEKKTTGNRYQWKAQCKDSTMIGDITSTPASYNGTLKMIEKNGRTTDMKMSGKRTGDCDYQDRSGEIKAMQQQSEGAMGKACQESLTQMQGQMLMNGMCPAEKTLYCQRLSTPEGYAKATQNIPADMINDPAAGFTPLVQGCGLSNASLLPKLCSRAVSDANFSFVSRLCPAEKPKLCAKALSSDQVNYVGANCPAEKAILIKKQCEGRRYTSQIDAKYRDFCAQAARGGTFRNDGSAEQAAPEPVQPVQPSQQPQSAPNDVLDSVNKLKGLFGF